MDESRANELRELIILHKEAKKKNNAALAYKINALILLYKDYNYRQIEDALMLNERTVRRYRDIYLSSGVAGLMKDNYKGGVSKLSESQRKELVKDIESKLFPTAAGVCEHVKKKYGINYTPEGMVRLLHKFNI